MTYRIYFNRWNDFPLIWSVDDGSQANEKIVSQVILDEVEGRTMTGQGDNVNSPSAWIEATGVLTIQGETATIRRAV